MKASLCSKHCLSLICIHTSAIMNVIMLSHLVSYSESSELLQDSQDPNPLIRALAVRTMGCIRVDKITEYLCDPLQRCLKVMAWSGSLLSPQSTLTITRREVMCQSLHQPCVAKEAPIGEVIWGAVQDDDPYVRKTAAVCVAKLFDINPELVEDRGFLDLLKVPFAPRSTDLRLLVASGFAPWTWLVLQEYSSQCMQVS